MGVRYREFRRAGAPSQTAAALGEAPAPKGRLWLVPTAETSWKCGSIGKAARWAQGAAEIGAAQSGSSVPAEPLSGGPCPLPALFQRAEWARERKWASEAPTKLDCALRSRA